MQEAEVAATSMTSSLITWSSCIKLSSRPLGIQSAKSIATRSTYSQLGSVCREHICEARGSGCHKGAQISVLLCGLKFTYSAAAAALAPNTSFAGGAYVRAGVQGAKSVPPLIQP